MKLSPDQEKFRLQHEILAKRDLMDQLVSRHNQLALLVPKVLTEDVVAEVQLTLGEIDDNMERLLAVVTELEGLCKRSPFRQTRIVEDASTP